MLRYVPLLNLHTCCNPGLHISLALGWEEAWAGTWLSFDPGILKSRIQITLCF